MTIEASIIGLRLDLAAGFARPERYANMARARYFSLALVRQPRSGAPVQKEERGHGFP